MHFAASCDPIEKNTEFALKLNLNYPILSDPDGTVADAYGIFNKKRGFSGRATFIIDDKGNIAHVDKKVSTRTHGADVVKKLKELTSQTK